MLLIEMCIFRALNLTSLTKEHLVLDGVEVVTSQKPIGMVMILLNKHRIFESFTLQIKSTKVTS